MLLTKVTLSNYGVYRDKNEFDFRCDIEKPVILCGGTNGAGKTTLFESILLCLYGISFFDKKITQKQYHEFLGRKIHRFLGTPVSASEASITVEFQFAHQGKVDEYKVHRMWESDDGKVSEKLTISKLEGDWKPLDKIEESQWQSFINELIPRGIAKLFFFDGEKIVEMAQEGNEDIEIKSSFDTLLGLDLVEQLRSDINLSLLRNLKGDSKKIQEQIDRFTSEKDEADGKIQRYADQIVELNSDIEKIQKETNVQEEKISKLGGGYASKRAEFKEKKIQLKAKLEQIEEEIRNNCADILPFTLIPKQLESVQKQLEIDQSILKNTFEKEILESNFSNIKSKVNSKKFWGGVSVDSKVKNELLSKLSSLFEETTEGSSVTEKSLFNFSVDDTSKLIGLIKKIKNDTGKLLEKSTKKFSETYDELQIVEVSLTSAPTDDEIGQLISELNEMNKEIGSLTAQIEEKHSLIATEKALIKTINVKMREIVADKHKSKRNASGADIAGKVDNVLEEYSQRLRKSKLKLLEDYLLQGIQMLIHKENFIEKVSINKETFEVTLYRKNDDEMLKSELSKGEQQMFVTAVLWALAKTSGRPLPFIIDTPLARLDKEHRVSLIEKFFPIASHQVLIFSTDTEVDENFYPKLQPYITRSYSMFYNSKKGKTTKRDGYFWDEKGEKVIEV
uniref:SMC protein-like protein n=1 Tax=uncultured marine thaumarchaeote KM3_47_F06 TaxID=1456168 RepID=A0A075H420_9ARCH|nr:SMC protein-like protein [uncultured marine thaumarchaeote KM3_47_F06]